MLPARSLERRAVPEGAAPAPSTASQEGWHLHQGPRLPARSLAQAGLGASLTAPESSQADSKGIRSQDISPKKLKMQEIKPNSKYQPGPLAQKPVQSQAGLSCAMLVQGGKPLPCLSPSAKELGTQEPAVLPARACAVSSLLQPGFQRPGQDRNPRDSCYRGMESGTWYIQMLIKEKPQSQGAEKRPRCNSTSQTLTREGNLSIQLCSNSWKFAGQNRSQVSFSHSVPQVCICHLPPS